MELQSERARRFTRTTDSAFGLFGVDEHSANGNEISALALGLLHPSHPTFVGRVSVGRRGSERVARSWNSSRRLLSFVLPRRSSTSPDTPHLWGLSFFNICKVEKLTA
jgi:hypothetical protein